MSHFIVLKFVSFSVVASDIPTTSTISHLALQPSLLRQRFHDKGQTGSELMDYHRAGISTSIKSSSEALPSDK